MGELAGIRTRWAAIGAAVAVTLGAAGLGSMNIASAEISSGDRPVYIPIDGCRLIDTRAQPEFNVGDKDTPFAADQTLTITAHGSNGQCTGPNAIPTDAVGLTLNVTPVNATQETFLTVWADGADPGTSALNPSPGEPPTPNAVNTPLTNTGTFNVRNNVGTVDVVIDITGYYADHNHDDRYYTEDEVDALVAAAVDDADDISDGAYTIAALVSASGDVERVQGLPPGATLEVTLQSTGTYIFVLDDIDSLDLPFELPIVVANALSLAGVTCTPGGGGGLGGDPLTVYSSFVYCNTAAGADTNAAFHVVVHFERG